MTPGTRDVVTVGPLRYGKTAIRFIEVDRRAPAERAREMTARVSLTGGIDEAYLEGDNARMVTTDALAGLVQQRCGELVGTAPEEMAIAVVSTLATHYPHLPDIALSLDVRALEAVDGARHCHIRSSREVMAATARLRGTTVRCRARLRGLSLLRTSGSRFEGFVVDAYTTTRPATDRAIGGAVEASWEARHDERQVDWTALRSAVRTALVASFSGEESSSVQHLAYLMARRALSEAPALGAIDVALSTIRLSPRSPGHESAVHAEEPAAQAFGLSKAPRGTVRARVRREAPVAPSRPGTSEGDDR